RVGGLTVVLAGLGDAVAVLGLDLRLRRRPTLGIHGQGQGEGRCNGGGDDQVRLLHVGSPFLRGLLNRTMTTPYGCRPPGRARGHRDRASALWTRILRGTVRSDCHSRVNSRPGAALQPRWSSCPTLKVRATLHA